MESTLLRSVLAVTATTVVSGALLVGCQHRTSTVDTPTASRSTTTVEPAPAVKETTAKAADAVGDAAITAKVKTALMADPDVKALQIDVDTKNGVVTLNGKVDQRTSVDKAVKIARAVDGVQSVETHLSQ